MTVLCVVVPCILVEICRTFREFDYGDNPDDGGSKHL
jgi:hypothetical protein